MSPISPSGTEPTRLPRPTRIDGLSPARDVHRRALVCVSHREPFARRKVGRTEQLVRTTGGLVTALDAALRELGGRWIASGAEDRQSRAPEDAKGRSYDVDQVGLSSREVEAYYSGFSNRVVWPLFHYFIGRVAFDASEWREYEKVNARFSEAVAKALDGEDDPIAWVHDYHLMLAPRLIREKRPRATVGFFLHIPFPAFEVFRILPTRREVLEGLLGADLVGFHTEAYRDAFLDSARRLLGARIDKSGAVEHRGRLTRTLVAPIGIDVAHLSSLGQDPATLAKAQRLRRTVPGDQIVLGVDRLDYSKGIVERIEGFQRLLERQPHLRGRVTLVQIAVPSRERIGDYKRLKKDVDEAVGRIDGRFGDASWMPVRYFTRSLTADELAAWYRSADVCLVTPLRDGLNLVAKEYVATRSDLGGALVLSEFCGASEELPQAYFVNPYGPDSIADALEQALTDDRIDRERRMSALRSRVEQNDVHHWARLFLRELAKS